MTTESSTDPKVTIKTIKVFSSESNKLDELEREIVKLKKQARETSAALKKEAK